MTLAFASFKDFKLFQMDVKGTFLNSFIDEEVCRTNPRFVERIHPDFIFKLEKALYGLKQAPRTQYERLSNFLILNDFNKGKVDTTL